LEKYQETMTVHNMRERLRSTGAIGNQVKLVPLVHILLFKYNQDWHELGKYFFLILKLPKLTRVK